MARTTLDGIQNKLSMHEAAEKALEHIGKESSYLDIYNNIIKNKLFEFGARKEPPEQILKKIIERKCINAKSSTKTKEVLFYKVGSRNFGLLKWLTNEEIKRYSIESDKELSLQKELTSLKEQLNQTKIEIEKLSTIKSKTEDFNDKFESFQTIYRDNKEQNHSIKEFFDKFSTEKENVENLLKSLKDNKHQLNVAKLDNGFIDLLDKKEIEKKNTFITLKFFGFSIFIVPIITVILILFGIEINTIISIPLLTIEIFLVYYFRIVLHNYNSIDEQILQLENKSALLKFISDYVEYKKDNDIKQDDISKFEEIIFSKISPNMKTIPTSPDVISLVEKVAKIIKK